MGESEMYIYIDRYIDIWGLMDKCFKESGRMDRPARGRAQGRTTYNTLLSVM